MIIISKIFSPTGHYYIFSIFSTETCINVAIRKKCNYIEDISEKAMAPHSSTLAWKIPWMEEPGGLQSMWSLRVGHD